MQTWIGDVSSEHEHKQNTWIPIQPSGTTDTFERKSCKKFGVYGKGLAKKFTPQCLN